MTGIETRRTGIRTRIAVAPASCSRISNSLLSAICAAAICFLPPPAVADNIDVELIRQAPKIVKYLKDRNHKHVGVLTFRVQKDGRRPAFRAALTNNNMADRMQNALTLAMNPEEPVQVIETAWAAAGDQLQKASYRTPRDRKRLFDVRYRLPINTPQRYVPADAFVTGRVRVSDDYRTTLISIETFDKRRPQSFSQILEFEVDSDRYILADLGYGFSLSRRGVRFMRSADDADILTVVDEESRRGKAGRTGGAAEYEGEFPVKLQVLYDGAAQELEPDGDLGPDNRIVAEPEAGQRVTFVIENTTSERLGVVLTVNGESVLYRQRGLPNQLTRLVLHPGKKYRIKGFYERDRQAYRPIVGLSQQDTQQRLSDLVSDDLAGLLHLYVFRKQAPELSEAAVAASRGSLRRTNLQPTTARRPGSWAELQSRIYGTLALRPGRGLMAAGDELQQQEVSLERLGDLRLTDTMIIRYYSPTSDED